MTGLIKCTLNNNTETIGSNAFEFCHSLKEFNIDITNSNLTKLGSYSFHETSIKTINIPPLVNTIECGTFCDCKFLKEINLSTESTLEQIEDYSFACDLLLKNINIPKTIKKISNKSIMIHSNEFYFVMDDHSVYTSENNLLFVPRDLKTFKINENSFCGHNISNALFSDNSLKCIEAYGFAHSTSLKKFKFQNQLSKLVMKHLSVVKNLNL